MERKQKWQIEVNDCIRSTTAHILHAICHRANARPTSSSSFSFHLIFSSIAFAFCILFHSIWSVRVENVWNEMIEIMSFSLYLFRLWYDVLLFLRLCSKCFASNVVIFCIFLLLRSYSKCITWYFFIASFFWKQRKKK